MHTRAQLWACTHARGNAQECLHDPESSENAHRLETKRRSEFAALQQTYNPFSQPRFRSAGGHGKHRTDSQASAEGAGDPSQMGLSAHCTSLHLMALKIQRSHKQPK